MGCKPHNIKHFMCARGLVAAQPTCPDLETAAMQRTCGSLSGRSPSHVANYQPRGAAPLGKWGKVARPIEQLTNIGATRRSAMAFGVESVMSGTAIFNETGALTKEPNGFVLTRFPLGTLEFAGPMDQF
jgi:hypothetical protein